MKKTNFYKKYPKSVAEIYVILKSQNRPIRISELNNSTYYSPRSVRRALKRLFDLNLVIKIPDYNDMRSYFLVTQSNYALKQLSLL